MATDGRTPVRQVSVRRGFGLLPPRARACRANRGRARDSCSSTIASIEALCFGSAHVSVVRIEAEAMIARADRYPGATAFALLTLASVTAMSGEAHESRQLYLRAKSIAEEMGLGSLLAVAAFFSQDVGLLFGDPEFTEREARAGYERLEAVGDKGHRSTMAAVLAEALYQLGRYDEAEQFADIGHRAGVTQRCRDTGPGARREGEASRLEAGLGRRRTRRAVRLSSTRTRPMTSTCAPTFCCRSPRFFASAATTRRRRLPWKRPPTRATRRATSSGRRTLVGVIAELNAVAV